MAAIKPPRSPPWTERARLTRSCRSDGPQARSRQRGFPAEIGAAGQQPSAPDRTAGFAGAAQGGIWTYDPAGRACRTPRTDDQPALSIGALVIAPSAPNIVYAGTGEGAPVRRQLLRQRRDEVPPTAASTWANVSGSTFQRCFHDRASRWTRPTPTTSTSRWAAAAAASAGSARPTRPRSASSSRPTAACTWKLRKGTTDPVRSPTGHRHRPADTDHVLYASFWGDAMYKSIDAGRSPGRRS